MKYLSFLIILFSINSFSDDYKSANRLQDGDVISADVFNDILDRIELTLKSASASDLVGLIQTIDGMLYRQRADTIFLMEIFKYVFVRSGAGFRIFCRICIFIHS